jgi:hypothetical protein
MSRQTRAFVMNRGYGLMVEIREEREKLVAVAESPD